MARRKPKFLLVCRRVSLALGRAQVELKQIWIKAPHTVAGAGRMALQVAGHQLSTGFDHFRFLEDVFPHHTSVPNRRSGKNRTKLLRGAGS